MRNNKSGSTTTTSSIVLSLRDQRNNAIRAEYFRLFNDEGKRTEIILKQLSAKWYLAQTTIEHIVWQRGVYRAMALGNSSLSNQPQA